MLFICVFHFKQNSCPWQLVSNPEKTPLHTFFCAYDLSDMPAGSKVWGISICYYLLSIHIFCLLSVMAQICFLISTCMTENMHHVDLLRFSILLIKMECFFNLFLSFYVEISLIFLAHVWHICCLVLFVNFYFFGR